MLVAALGLGAADCGDDASMAQPAYGVFVPDTDLNATPDLSHHDAANND